MPMIRIKPELLSLLVNGKIKQFTASELTDAYMSQPECKYHTRKAAQQFVYKNILRLEDRALVERVDSMSGRSLTFRLTPAFHSSGIGVSEVKTLVSSDNINQESVIKSLREKLNSYKLELLSAIGETEEYDAISEDLPQIRQQIQELYNQSRDRCSKTLGKVRALESLISSQKNF